MYLFRLFTWHLHAVHVLLLLIITAAIALPAGRPRKGKLAKGIGDSVFQSDLPGGASSEPPQKKQKSEVSEVSLARSTPKKHWIGVVIESGLDDPKANWVIVSVPEEDLHKDNIRLVGYATSKNYQPSLTKWSRQVKSATPGGVNGAVVIMSKDHPSLLIEIGSATMSLKMRYNLARDMRKAVNTHRCDQLPDVPSIYQYAVLYEDAMKERGVKIHHYDISKTSDFGKAFARKVNEKGTGAGEVLSEEFNKWEWALYERIKNGGADVLRTSLGKYNKDILEDLWDEVYELPRGFLDDQDIDDEKYKDPKNWGKALD
ncbi:hypothetical protein C8R42DRAFT_725617 [Lentinula raphanica]|nr:hypothetical protein C8R42DRAFT_725617 [Lentinula raphanica]